jgi:predicted RNA-binding protein with PUA-like domain
MQYWLIKSEPYLFSYSDLEQKGSTLWDGVRNYSARNNLRAMKLGDQALFYHSNEGLEIVGIAEVTKEHFPDVTATEGDWSVVEFKPLQRLKRPITLKEIKADPALQQMDLLRLSRLSVSGVRLEEYAHILGLSDV